MTAIFYFSGAGHSETLAAWVAGELRAPAYQIGADFCSKANTAVIVFPVYCQNIPPPVKAFLPTISAEYIVLLTTYGGICPGNVLQEASRRVSGTVIAAAAIPTGHSLLSESDAEDYSALKPILERIRSPQPAKVPKLYKNPFADFFPSWRSRMGVAIARTSACSHCGICEASCPQQAIRDGKPNRKCIRCLRCVRLCPKGALHFSLRPITRRYLERRRTDRWHLFL